MIYTLRIRNRYRWTGPVSFRRPELTLFLVFGIYRLIYRCYSQPITWGAQSLSLSSLSNNMTLCPGMSCSPSANDAPAAYNGNSRCWYKCPGSFDPDVARLSSDQQSCPQRITSVYLSCECHCRQAPLCMRLVAQTYLLPTRSHTPCPPPFVPWHPVLHLRSCSRSGRMRKGLRGCAEKKRTSRWGSDEKGVGEGLVSFSLLLLLHPNTPTRSGLLCKPTEQVAYSPASGAHSPLSTLVSPPFPIDLVPPKSYLPHWPHTVHPTHFPAISTYTSWLPKLIRICPMPFHAICCCNCPPDAHLLTYTI